MTTPDGRQPVLEAKGIIKTFGHVVGLAGVDLQLYPGEVLAVIGDNGAGKSTLIKCLSGAMTPDEGQLLIDGNPVSFKSTQDARASGIETVYQTLAVAPALDIASNLFLARELRRPGPLGSVFRMLDTGAMKRQAKEHIKRSQSPAPPPSAARSSSSTNPPPHLVYGKPVRCSSWSATCATAAWASS
jgi:fructose transport system ATP-binding protein